MKSTRILILAINLGLWGGRPAALLAQAGSSARPAGVLTGIVKSAAGKMLEGIVVSAQANAKPITTSVFTDEDGRYVFPPLEEGRYRTWAQAVGYQAGNSEVTIGSTGRVQQDFTLGILKDFSMQLSGSEWVAALPSDTPENRRMKELFQHQCGGCHPTDFVLQKRFDERGWKAVISAMAFYNTTAYWSKTALLNVPHFMGDLAPYLAKMRGPGPSPMKFQPLPRPKGDAALAVITEYAIPPVGLPGEVSTDAGSDWSLGAPSAMYNRTSHDVAIDFDGNAWISAYMVNPNRSYAKIDTRTGQVTNFKIPDPGNDYVPSTHAVVTGPDGMVWATIRWQVDDAPSVRPGSFGRIDPKTGKVEVFTPPAGTPGVGGHLDVDDEGTVWGATSKGGIRFDPSTHEFTLFNSISPNARTYGVAADSEGNDWWAEINVDKVGASDIKTGKSREVEMKPRSEFMELATEEDRKWYSRSAAGRQGNNQAPPWGQTPRRLGADRLGTSVWVANLFGQNIARVDIRTLEVKYYDVPLPYATPYDIDVDQNHMVWVSLRNASRVGKFDPKTEKWTVYQLPSVGCEARNITVDKKTGEVWVPCWRNGKITRLQFRTAQQLAATRADAVAIKK